MNKLIAVLALLAAPIIGASAGVLDPELIPHEPKIMMKSEAYPGATYLVGVTSICVKGGMLMTKAPHGVCASWIVDRAGANCVKWTKETLSTSVEFEKVVSVDRGGTVVAVKAQHALDYKIPVYVHDRAGVNQVGFQDHKIEACQ
ncbi:MAG: hypothetical protein WCH11_03950 [Bdellovibrio sp.]